MLRYSLNMYILSPLRNLCRSLRIDRCVSDRSCVKSCGSASESRTARSFPDIIVITWHHCQCFFSQFVAVIGLSWMTWLLYFMTCQIISWHVGGPVLLPKLIQLLKSANEWFFINNGLVQDYSNSVGKKHRTHRTFPMARPKCLMGDFANLYGIYTAHQTNV